ncbi:MAG: hypothetical protein WA064_00665 [Candidatus Moraniibacteriota bacterium]
MPFLRSRRITRQAANRSDFISGKDRAAGEKEEEDFSFENEVTVVAEGKKPLDGNMFSRNKALLAKCQLALNFKEEKEK